MLTNTFGTSAVVVLLVLAGCASTPGAKPEDMSKGQHDRTASDHDQIAASHAGGYNPNATATKEHCDRQAGYEYTGCWTSVTNPTAEHKSDAEKHRKMAADHRAAAQTLREVEARSCAGISDVDRDISPFDHPEDITAVAPYYAVPTTGVGPESETPTTKLFGAVVTFQAVRGMTVDWLQHIVDCHRARNAAMGFDVPEMSYCPLTVRGAQAKVASTGKGLSITVESDDPAVAQEILRRAQTLRGRSRG